MRCCAVPATNFFDGMAANIAGVDARLSRDLADADVSQFLAGRKRLERVAIRHTVGMDDKVEGEGGVADIRENAGARYFKLKLNGDPAHDADRLTRIGKELATLPYDYRVTLDANEQYADLAALSALVDRLDRDAALRPIAQKLLYIEQPMPRDITPPIAARRAGAARFHRRRGRRLLRRVPDRAGARLSRHLLEILQGHLQVGDQRDARGQMERGRRKMLHRRRGPDLPGGTCGAAGSRARRADRRHPCRAQRPPLCRRLWRYAGRRSGGVSRQRIPISMSATATRSGSRSMTAIS